jgi:hypothetical protein
MNGFQKARMLDFVIYYYTCDSETYQKIQQQGSKVSGEEEDMNGNYDVV